MTREMVIFWVSVVLVAYAAIVSSWNAFDIGYLENRQNYVYEVLRKRPLLAEQCVSFSDQKMTCFLAEQGACSCRFEPDEFDEEIAFRNEALDRAALLLLEEGEIAELHDIPERQD